MIIKGVFKFKSVTFRFLEIAKDENSLVVFKLNFEFLINKKISELEILRVINSFSASSPLIKTRYVGNESKKNQVIFIQEMLSFGENDSPTLLLSSLSILSIAPILFSNALNENNFPHRSVTEN
ncbi:TPA: hypothetical protein ACNU26_004107 [Aeromonas salmonicida]